jgi:predicted glycosyltransferase involved in capsule biosynthesis
MSLFGVKYGFLMQDVTYVIQARIDCPERLANLDFCIDFLQSNFDSPIVIVEGDKESLIEGRYYVKHVFIKDDSPVFNRARWVNIGVRNYTITPKVCLLDMDVFLDPKIHRLAVELLDYYPLVYPFDGNFYDIPQSYHIKGLRMADIKDEDKTSLHTQSVGGLQFVRTKDFLNIGMTNEYIRGWGYEDNEFYERFSKLGYRIYRTGNPLYHFTHPRTYNSDGRSPHVYENQEVYEKVVAMTEKELLEYIKGFPWRTRQ